METEDKIRTLIIYQRHYVQNQMVHEEIVEEVQVTIQDSAAGGGGAGGGGALCKSINDPHTTMFDGT